MIVNIKKHSGSCRLVDYVLKPTKEAVVIQSSMFSPQLNTAIGDGRTIGDDEFKQALSKELRGSFQSINSLRPRLGRNMTHVNLAFDPADGALSNIFKAEIATELMERMGYGNCYWVAIAHNRSDPEHKHTHDHDHIHILASRVDYTQNRAVPDKYDYPNTEKVLRQMEIEYNLTPFVPIWDRDFIPEMQWMIQIEEEEIEIEQKAKTKTLSR